MVEAAPPAPFIITKAEFLFELLIIALDPPPQLGLAVGLTVPSGDELNYLLPIVDRLEQMADDAGGDAPAPMPPEVPGMADFRSLTGNDLLAALADRQTELRSLIP